MATIPTPGSELRHVRKTITFDGSANNGLLNDVVPLFSITGRVMLCGHTAYISSSLVCAAAAATILEAYTGIPPYDLHQQTTADLLTGPKWWATDQGAYAGHQSVIPDPNTIQSTIIGLAIDNDIDLIVRDGGGGANVTGGTIIFDVWYRPITDDGALAGDDIDEPMRDHFWAKALSDIASVPAMTASALSGLNWVFALARNKLTQTATTQTLKKDDGTTTVGTASVSDDGTTFTRNEWS